MHVSSRSGTTPGICEMLDWDSSFFGLRIARFSGATFGRDAADAALRFCADHQIDCLYVLIDAANTDALHVAQQSGGCVVDIRVTLETALPPELPPAPTRVASIRPATDRDIPHLQGIARESHRDTRFYADPGFDRERCHRLYETWIEKSCRGYADAVFVAEHAGEAAGYVTCHKESIGTGRIGLIAVAPPLRSLGLGIQLLQSALAWCGSEGLQSVRVSTQARNVSGLRLYEHNGFVTVSVQMWFHLWRSRA